MPVVIERRTPSYGGFPKYIRLFPDAVPYRGGGRGTHLAIMLSLRLGGNLVLCSSLVAYGD
jgi:hypothetical protein